MTVWDNFFIAQLGASAALLGLLFVGVSINLNRILSIPRLPDRAFQSLVLLLTILIISTLFLVPGQSTLGLGIEILVVGVSVWLTNTWLDIGNIRKVEKKFLRIYYRVMILGQIASLSYIAGGIISIMFGTNGFYFVVPAVIFSFIKAIIDAWVLLIEINR
jgi:hypothetical protein